MDEDVPPEEGDASVNRRHIAIGLLGITVVLMAAGMVWWTPTAGTWVALALVSLAGTLLVIEEYRESR